MLNASSSKVRKGSQSLKESSLESKVSSRQSTEEMGSEDSDRCKPNSIEGKHWYELLKEKIGFDINAKKWMEEHPELASKNKSELLIRLACEVCLAKNTEYDPKNEEQNNKYIRFDTQRIFALFEVANELIDLSDRKNFVEFVCQKGNVQLLEMICKKESSKKITSTENQYRWQGTFTGYSKLIDLLQYVIDNRYSQEIVLCIAKKVYGYSHIFYNGQQYLHDSQVNHKECNYLAMKECLNSVVKLDYKNVVSVMLSGDIYHCIRLMRWEVFKGKQEFVEAYDVIKEAVADVINSWVEDKQFCKDDLQRLLDQGIEIDLHKMRKVDLIYQLGHLGKELTYIDNTNKKELGQELKKLGKEKGEVRLRPTVVGALISTLFFTNQDKAIKGESFTQKITFMDKSRKRKILNQLDEKINSGESIEDIISGLIESLHLGNHTSSNWFFREVLAKVVNKNLDKLKAVCAAICKEPMEELLRGEEIHENVTHVLQFFGVEVLTNQIVKSEIPSSCASIADQFMEDINVYSEREAKEDCSSDELAFSGLTRKIIRELEEKQDLTDKEKKDLVSKAFSKIKEGINILADGTATSVDVKDIFLSFELINDKITKEKRKEIVELVCQKDSVQLLEMICKKESEDLKSQSHVEQQYKWQGIFTGYSKLIDLLQYVIDNQCPQKIVLCIVNKIYGRAHIFYNGKQYLEPYALENMKSYSNYQDSVVRELLKQVINLGYKDAVSVMLAGDIYHSIRLMKWKVFKEKPEFLAAYNMIKETVADVTSSWVGGCKDFMLNLLDQGIEMNINKMDKADLIYQLDYLEKSVKSRNGINKKELIKNLKDLGKEKGKVRLKSTIVGALISTLFFNYQDKVMEGGLFILKIKRLDDSKKGKILDTLKKKISKEESIDSIMLELIKLLHLGNHIKSNWFFREVLVEVVNKNLDKLKAVCAAICKEPMEELLRGEEVHEDVIDVLQFFGVEKDFLLLRTSIAASGIDELVRNSKSIDESLSDRSEESISSSSRQSFADARLIRDEYSLTLPDPQKISTAVSINQERKSLPNISSESKKTQQQLLARKSMPILKSKKSHFAPSSKVTEKNNEGAMHKNYGQSKDNSYTDENFCYQDKTVSRRLVMPRVDLQSARDKRRERENVTLRKVSKQTFLDPPKFKDLFKANRMMYMKKTLDDFVLSYDVLSYHSLYGISSLQWNLNESVNSSRSSESDEQEFNELFINNDYFHKYEDAISKLMKGDTSAAQTLLLELAEQAVEPACYARALSLFKELVKNCDVQNSKEENNEMMEKSQDDIKEAVELLEFCMDTMNPASSFLLGIMKAFNIGNCSRFIKGPWQKDLTNVINVGKGFCDDCNLEESILQAIKRGSWDIQGSVGLGMRNKMEDVKKMFKYSLYEFVCEMILGKNINRSAMSDAFTVLSKDDFPEGLYAHGFMMIQGKIGSNSQEKVAINLLDRANELGHKGAKFMLGTLPLQKGVYCKSHKETISRIRMLESYINESDDSCSLNKSNIDKAALCLVAEYSSKKSVFLEYDAAKVKEILDMRNLHQKWEDIQHESMMSFGSDSVLNVQPMRFSTPQCSTAHSSQLPNFIGEISAISEVPGTKLSAPLAKNQDASKIL